MTSGITHIKRLVDDPTAELGEIVEKARTVFSVDADTRLDFSHVSTVVPSVMNELEMRWAMGHYGSLTGLRDVDKAIGSLKSGRLYVIAGRPSMGKSAFAFTICLNVASEVPVAFVSLEMPEHDLIMRALSGEAMVPYSHIETNTMTPYERAKVDAAINLPG